MLLLQRYLLDLEVEIISYLFFSPIQYPVLVPHKEQLNICLQSKKFLIFCFSLATTTVIIAFETILNLATLRRGSWKEVKRAEKEDPYVLTNSKYIVAFNSQYPSLSDKHPDFSNSLKVIAISYLIFPTRLSDCYSQRLFLIFPVHSPLTCSA